MHLLAYSVGIIFMVVHLLTHHIALCSYGSLSYAHL